VQQGKPVAGEPHVGRGRHTAQRPHEPAHAGCTAAVGVPLQVDHQAVRPQLEGAGGEELRLALGLPAVGVGPAPDPNPPGLEPLDDGLEMAAVEGRRPVGDLHNHVVETDLAAPRGDPVGVAVLTAAQIPDPHAPGHGVGLARPGAPGVWGVIRHNRYIPGAQ